MASPIDLLSPGELRVLQARGRGLTLRETADELAIDEQTAKNQLSALLHKLGAANTVEALRVVGWLVVPGEGRSRSTRSTTPRAIAAQLRAAARAIEELPAG